MEALIFFFFETYKCHPFIIIFFFFVCEKPKEREKKTVHPTGLFDQITHTHLHCVTKQLVLSQKHTVCPFIRIAVVYHSSCNKSTHNSNSNKNSNNNKNLSASAVGTVFLFFFILFIPFIML
jgi:hypothetical protein